MPAIENTTLYLSALIEENRNIHEVFREGLEDLNTLRVIFNQEDELNPTELVEEEATQTEAPLDNGGTPPPLNQSPSQSLPPVDAPNAPDSPLPSVRKDASEVTRLASVGNFPGKILTTADENIFGVYQD